MTTDERLKEIEERADYEQSSNRDIPWLLALVKKQRSALEAVSTWYSGSLDHQPGYVRIVRDALNFNPE